jgi:protein involved in polysaccharide export with SLBB domain
MISRRRVVCFGFVLVSAGLTLGTTPVATQEPDSFFVVGFIKNAGKYHLEANTTVGEAIDIAGGFMDRPVNRIEIVRVVNGEKEIALVSLNDEVRADDTVAVR